MEKNIIYTCSQHVDEGMDDYININECFPNLEKSNEGKCFICEKKSEYKIG